MSYAVKAIFYTLQGEGAQTGRPAVFCRFSRCNLWTGHERDRARAICRFCDTEFVGTDGDGGGVFETAEQLAEEVAFHWNNGRNKHARPFVVCTGGEPLLQLDKPAIDALHNRDFEIAIETNGTILPPRGIDWICVSPKSAAPFVLHAGNELKLVYPQDGLRPEQLTGLHFDHYFLQPMDGPELATNTQLALKYVLEHPQWRLSQQTHKLLGIP
jgi:7-carboxy-7-deazaguanine synthase